MIYIPTEWKNGDMITAEKLNNIEDGITGMQNRLDTSDAGSGWILTSASGDLLKWMPIEDFIRPMKTTDSIESLVAIDSSGSLIGVSISELLEVLFYPQPLESSVWTYDIDKGYEWLSYAALPFPSPSY